MDTARFVDAAGLERGDQLGHLLRHDVGRHRDDAFGSHGHHGQSQRIVTGQHGQAITAGLCNVGGLLDGAAALP